MLVGPMGLGAHAFPLSKGPYLTYPPFLGKSSLTVQFVDEHFVDSYYPTIENTFSKVIKYRNQDFATEIVDTAGQVSAPPVRQATRILPSFPKRPAAAIDRSNLPRYLFHRTNTVYSIPNILLASTATCWSTRSIPNNHLIWFGS